MRKLFAFAVLFLLAWSLNENGRLLCAFSGDLVYLHVQIPAASSHRQDDLRRFKSGNLAAKRSGGHCVQIIGVSLRIFFFFEGLLKNGTSSEDYCEAQCAANAASVSSGLATYSVAPATLISDNTSGSSAQVTAVSVTAGTATATVHCVGATDTFTLTFLHKF